MSACLRHQRCCSEKYKHRYNKQHAIFIYFKWCESYIVHQSELVSIDSTSTWHVLGWLLLFLLLFPRNYSHFHSPDNTSFTFSHFPPLRYSVPSSHVPTNKCIWNNLRTHAQNLHHWLFYFYLFWRFGFSAHIYWSTTTRSIPVLHFIYLRHI